MYFGFTSHPFTVTWRVNVFHRFRFILCQQSTTPKSTMGSFCSLLLLFLLQNRLYSRHDSLLPAMNATSTAIHCMPFTLISCKICTELQISFISNRLDVHCICDWGLGIVCACNTYTQFYLYFSFSLWVDSSSVELNLSHIGVCSFTVHSFSFCCLRDSLCVAFAQQKKEPVKCVFFFIYISTIDASTRASSIHCRCIDSSIFNLHCKYVQ